MNTQLSKDQFENVDKYVANKKNGMKELRATQLDLVVKNIEHIRQFATQILVISASLAVLSLSSFGGSSSAIKIEWVFRLALIILLIIVGYGAYYLKETLEKENNALLVGQEKLNRDFALWEEALRIVTIEKSIESVNQLNEFENKQLEKYLSPYKKIEKPSNGLSFLVGFLILSIILIIISLFNQTTYEKILLEYLIIIMSLRIS